MELGYVLKNDITEKIGSFEKLLPNIKYLVPVVELPIIDFKDTEKINAVDIVAANACSTEYILGYPVKYDEKIDPNNIDTYLYLNGELIDSGKSSVAMEDQKEALVLLVNKIISEGYEIKAGKVLITGVLGKLIPIEKGFYQARYSNIGTNNKVDFTVE